MVITRVKDVRCENINWEALGDRFQEFRENRDMSHLEVSQELNVTEYCIKSLENGSERKAVNIIWSISLRWNLSINWLLNGLGDPHGPDPLGLMPETFHIQKGAGIRRSHDRANAEEGRYSDHVLEFVIAIDKFKIKNKIPFPSLTQIYEIITALGYRKSAPSRIAPLGYIVEDQQHSEKLKLTNEKDETDLAKICPSFKLNSARPVPKQLQQAEIGKTKPQPTVAKTKKVKEQQPAVQKKSNSILDRIRIGISN